MDSLFQQVFEARSPGIQTDEMLAQHTGDDGHQTENPFTEYSHDQGGQQCWHRDHHGRLIVNQLGAIFSAAHGHVAVQYAIAMGFRVAAIDVSPDKLELARSYGAECLINALDNPVASLKQQIPGGVHAVLVTATANAAFEQSIKMLRPGGTAVFIGLPGGDADTVRARLTCTSEIGRAHV